MQERAAPEWDLPDQNQISFIDLDTMNFEFGVIMNIRWLDEQISLSLWTFAKSVSDVVS